MLRVRPTENIQKMPIRDLVYTRRDSPTISIIRRSCFAVRLQIEIVEILLFMWCAYHCHAHIRHSDGDGCVVFGRRRTTFLYARPWRLVVNSTAANRMRAYCVRQVETPSSIYHFVANLRWIFHSMRWKFFHWSMVWTGHTENTLKFLRAIEKRPMGVSHTSGSIKWKTPNEMLCYKSLHTFSISQAIFKFICEFDFFFFLFVFLVEIVCVQVTSCTHGVLNTVLGCETKKR